MKRPRILAVVAMGLALVTAALAYRLQFDRCTRANFDQIQSGMTLTQVETILGPSHPGQKNGETEGTAEEFRTADVVIRDEACLVFYAPRADDDVEWEYWEGTAGMIEVQFKNGEAGFRMWLRREGIVDRIEHLWGKWF
jgi:hypothetical protein